MDDLNSGRIYDFAKKLAVSMKLKDLRDEKLVLHIIDCFHCYVAGQLSTSKLACLLGVELCDIIHVRECQALMLPSAQALLAWRRVLEVEDKLEEEKND